MGRWLLFVNLERRLYELCRSLLHWQPGGRSQWTFIYQSQATEFSSNPVTKYHLQEDCVVEVSYSFPKLTLFDPQHSTKKPSLWSTVPSTLCIQYPRSTALVWTVHNILKLVFLGGEGRGGLTWTGISCTKSHAFHLMQVPFTRIIMLLFSSVVITHPT